MGPSHVDRTILVEHHRADDVLFLGMDPLGLESFGTSSSWLHIGSTALLPKDCLSRSSFPDVSPHELADGIVFLMYQGFQYIESSQAYLVMVSLTISKILAYVPAGVFSDLIGLVVSKGIFFLYNLIIY